MAVPGAGGGCTVLRIPGTLCDERIWRKMHWPASWRVRDARLADCDDLARAASSLLASSTGPLVPVGFSMGGMIALEMARQAPGRLAGMVLIATNHLADQPERRAARDRNLGLVASAGLPAMVRDELMPRYSSGHPDPADGRTVADMALSAGPDVLGRQYRALAFRRDQSATLAQFDGPVLIVAGADDALCDPVRQQEMAALARQAEFHVVPGVGHMVPLEAPHRLMAVVKEWALARIEEMACRIAS